MTVTKRSCLWCYFMQHLSILTTGKATARRSLRCYCGNTPKGNYGFIISQMKEIINSPISSNMCLSCILPIIHLKLECSTHIRWPFWPIGNTVLNSFQLCLSAIWCQAGSVWCAFCCCFFWSFCAEDSCCAWKQGWWEQGERTWTVNLWSVKKNKKWRC